MVLQHNKTYLNHLDQRVKMKQVDNVNDYGHQIHIEEYLYNQSKIKKLTK